MKQICDYERFRQDGKMAMVRLERMLRSRVGRTIMHRQVRAVYEMAFCLMACIFMVLMAQIIWRHSLAPDVPIAGISLEVAFVIVQLHLAPLLFWEGATLSKIKKVYGRIMLALDMDPDDRERELLEEYLRSARVLGGGRSRKAIYSLIVSLGAWEAVHSGSFLVLFSTALLALVCGWKIAGREDLEKIFRKIESE